MIEPTKSWLEATKVALESLQEDYKINRGMILTEGDLECHLFNKLMQQEIFSGYHNSKNDTFQYDPENNSELKTGYVHSQVTWFKPGTKSGFEVDLTISDPAKLEVVNIELFEEWPSKGFTYDGPSIAIELKFIRDVSKAKLYGQEDFLKLRDRLIPAKLENIRTESYKESNQDNIAFISVVGCKNKELFDTAKEYLGKHLADENTACPNNLFTCVFYQDEIIFNNYHLIENYIKTYR